MAKQCSSYGDYTGKEEAEVDATRQKEIAEQDEVVSDQRIELAANMADMIISSPNDYSVSVVEETCEVGLGSQFAVQACADTVAGILKNQHPSINDREKEGDKVKVNGFMESISGNGPQLEGIDLAVVLNGVQMVKESVRPSSNGLGQDGVGHIDIDPQTQGCRTSSSSILGSGSSCVQPTFKLLKSNGGRGKSLQIIHGSRRNGGSTSKSKEVEHGRKEIRGRCSRQSGPVAMGSWSRGALFRATAGSSLKPDSNGKGKCKTKSPQGEAEATVQLGKALGICFGGKEKEVIKKLVNMDVKDRAKAAQRKVEIQKEPAVQD
ncbi:hypothetical protein LOK49_LG03G00970 [Camellia lanceoleosa]|uniref:Uncharacterized protein n=1 Tax=Camellia lanceoleosa TaxID=1840588 RepID=A0ACC0I8T5_9ERIC|nr:hypothetical protein LOK49_LG03G00970 [Camellia lanceoleosa]